MSIQNFCKSQTWLCFMQPKKSGESQLQVDNFYNSGPGTRRELQNHSGYQNRNCQHQVVNYSPTIIKICYRQQGKGEVCLKLITRVTPLKAGELKV